MNNNKYSEQQILAKISEYIDSTYKGHYVGKDEIQTLDVWSTLGTAGSTCRDTALKYLMRYGKKGGKNPEDLLKAIHYIILLWHYDHLADNRLSQSGERESYITLDTNNPAANTVFVAETSDTPVLTKEQREQVTEKQTQNTTNEVIDQMDILLQQIEQRKKTGVK